MSREMLLHHVRPSLRSRATGWAWIFARLVTVLACNTLGCGHGGSPQTCPRPLPAIQSTGVPPTGATTCRLSQ